MVLILSVLIGVTLELTWAKPAVKHYATKYDHIDVEAILNNRRMVNYYSACLLSKGPCPPEGVEFKRILPEALQTNCGRCTEKQSTVTLRAIKRLKKEYPKIWSQLSEQWDPDDVYVKKFELTFGPKTDTPTKVEKPIIISNRFGVGQDESTDNTIDGNFLMTITTITQQNPQDSTTQKITTSTNTIPSSTIISTSTKNDFPYEPSSPSSTARTTTVTTTATTTTSKTTTTSSTRLPPIPGLLPINTFFTNPPIPIRPIVSLNIGANIGATVKAIKQVERVVAEIALEKIGMIKSLFLGPWKRTKRKYS